MKYTGKYNIEEIKDTDLKEIQRKLLELKGITNVKEFLNPKSAHLENAIELDNIDVAAQCLKHHIDGNSKMFIQVDSDVDGFCSAAMTYLYLKQIDENLNIEWRVHTDKQHGIIVDTVPKDTDLVIIPDAGSNQKEELEELEDLGMDVIVLDHHEAKLYNTNAIIVNNNMEKCQYNNKDLCGAGIVYKFIKYYDEKYNYDFADKMIDLTAIALIGDMMKVNGLENRFLINWGLKSISNVGLAQLITTQSFSMGNKLNNTTIAFYIVPLMNALIRVGEVEDKEKLFKALIDGNQLVESTKRGARGETETLATQIARTCTNAKSKQDRLKKKISEELEKIIEKNALNKNKILFVPTDSVKDFDTNLTGLIAMQLCSKYNKPTIVAKKVKIEGDYYYRGSLRNSSNSELKSFREFCEKSGYCEYAQGHESAAGISIHEDRIKGFLEYANDKLKDMDFSEGVYEADFIADAYDKNLYDIVLAIGQLDVWGQGVEEPNIVFENITIKPSSLKVMGKDGSSVKIEVNGIPFIKFKDIEFIEKLQKNELSKVTIIGRANLNEWCGTLTPQVFINDYEIVDVTNDF